MEVSQNNEERSAGRPVLLTVLCMLSFITFVPFLAASMGGVFFPELSFAVLSETGVETGSLNREVFLLLATTATVITALMLWGVILMFFRKTGGYIMFVIPSSVMLLIEIAAAIITPDVVIIIIAVMNVVMITGFAVSLRLMKRKSHA